MIDKNLLYRNLDNNAMSATEYKRQLRAFFKEKLELQERHPERSKEIAYEIAGLMSTEFVRHSLPSNDPYAKVLYWAGELELPEAHRAKGASWQSLRDIIQQLPL